MASAPRAKRVLVLGCPGAGKTTLAKRLAASTGLPLHHLDDEHWSAGWTRPDPLWWEQRQRELTSRPHWIIDGNYLETIHLRAVNADLVIILDTGTLRCLLRVMWRAWRIRRGDHSALPARVCAGSGAQRRVRPTKDFLPLLRKVVWFRSRDLWRVIRLARANPAAQVVIAVGPGRARFRIRRAARRLTRAGVLATAIPVTDVADLVGTRISAPGRTAGHDC